MHALVAPYASQALEARCLIVHGIMVQSRKKSGCQPQQDNLIHACPVCVLLTVVVDTESVGESHSIFINDRVYHMIV